MSKTPRKQRLLSAREVAQIKRAGRSKRRDAHALAERLGCSASHIRNIWRGLHWPNIEE